jgi:hypothetical protein
MNIQPLNPVNWKKNRIVKHVSEAIRARGLEEELEISSFTDETSYAVLRKKDGSKKSFVVVEGPMRDWVAGLAKDLGHQLISLHLNAAAVNILDAFLRTNGDTFLLNSEGESPELREELEEKMPLCIERIGKLTGRLNSLLGNLTTGDAGDAGEVAETAHVLRDGLDLFLDVCSSRARGEKRLYQVDSFLTLSKQLL